jgi:carbonic anhydrase
MGAPGESWVILHILLVPATVFVGKPEDKMGDTKTTLTADDALSRLISGNLRYVDDDPMPADISRERRLAVAQAQYPFACLVGCSDSRVGPEQLFGVGLGDLFIVRTAGNNVGTNGMGSIEFAVAQLGVPLIVVLGHERCGAVGAAVKVVTDDLQLGGSMGKMIEPIIPAVLHAQRSLPEFGDLMDAAVHENVRRMVRRLRTASEPMLMEPQAAGRLKVVGAYYDLDTGSVAFFDRG